MPKKGSRKGSNKGKKAAAKKEQAKEESAPVSFLVPEFRWAQNKEQVFLTVEVGDVEGCKCDISEEKFHFQGKSKDGKFYQLDFSFKNPVDKEESTFAVKPRGVEVLLSKKDKKADEFWTHILSPEDKTKLKLHCKVDWDLWVDEDEEEEKSFGDFGMGGMPGMGGGMPGMGGMGGMGDMGGMDFSKMMGSMGGMGDLGGAGAPEDEVDSDDEDLPDLEDAEEEDEEAKKKADDEQN